MKYHYLHQWFESIVAEQPEKAAIVDHSSEITFSELNHKATELAKVLSKLMGESTNVAVMMPGSSDLIRSLLGIFKAGGIYLPLSAEFSDKRLVQVFQQCSPDILIISGSEFETVKTRLVNTGCQAKYILALNAQEKFQVYSHHKDGDWAPYEIIVDDSADNASVELTDESYIFYTSGSTGEAKAILGSHKSLSHFIHWEIEEFDIDSTCRVSQLVHPVFDASLRDIFVPLCTGGTLYIPDQSTTQNPSLLVDWIEANGITLIHCVPTLLRVITEELKKREQKGLFESLQYLLISGEPLYVKDVRQWREKVGEHVQMVNLYGTTETTLVKTFHRIGGLSDDDNQVLHVGKPISNTVVAIINNQHLCQPGEMGEIYIKTPFWSKGYLFNNDFNKKVFVQNPLIKDREDIVYKTGDLGMFLKSGEIEVKGRLDQQVKVNGIRIELGEIEQTLLNIPGIDQAVLTHQKDPEGGVILLAYYTGDERSAEELRELMLTELNQNVIPAHIQYLDELPLTINGKVDRKALPKPSELLQSVQNYEPVQNDVEAKIEKLWKEVLDVEKIGRSVSFFTIGGTSLKAIRLISALYKEFGTLVKVLDIFSNPTIAQMAKLVGSEPIEGFKEIMPVAISDEYRASLQQKRLWILDQFEKKQTTYNMPGAFELTGPVDLDSLIFALKDLVQRHESLRTSFFMKDEVLYQKIHDFEDLDFAPEVIEVRTLPNGEQEVEEILQQKLNDSFDLSVAPLFKATLISYSETRVVLHFNTHHIIFDAWSMYVMARDIVVSYVAHTANRSSDLEPLNIQYKDYTAWLFDNLQDRSEADEAFWLDIFDDEIQSLNLPTDYPRTEKQTFEGKKLKFELHPDTCNALSTYVTGQEVTHFNLLIAAVDTLLYYYSGQKDIVLGVPVTGRHHKVLEDQIGFYVNTIALRLQFEAETELSELIQQVKQKSLEAYEHSIYPFDELVEKLQAGADISRSSLFDVMVQMQDTDVKELALKLPQDIEMKPIDLDHQSSKFDLTFNFEVLEDKKSVTGWIEYNTGLFAVDTILQMQKVLEAIIQDITLPENGHLTLKELKQSLNKRFEAQGQVANDAFSSMEISEDF